MDRPTNVDRTSVAADGIDDPNSIRGIILPDEEPLPSGGGLHRLPIDLVTPVMCITVSDTESEDGECDNNLRESETQDVDWLVKSQQISNGHVMKNENILH